MKVLVRHFLDSLLHPETAASEDGFLEWLAQLLGVLVAACWFFPAYALQGRYAYLHGLPSPEPYRRALEGHFMMILALVMILTALLTAIEWPMLFPSRRDHLVLSPLPLRRLDLFAAKLAAVLLFESLFIAATAGVLGVMLPAIATGPHEHHGFFVNIAAHLTGALSACYFTFFALFAAQGILVALLPSASYLFQSLLLLSATCALPLLPYFPARDLLHAPWLPPAWFRAITAALLGEPQTLAARGVAALGAAFAVTAVTYGVAYLRFSHQALEVAGRRRGPSSWWVGRGVGAFLGKTLARGREQELVWMMIAGLGVALLAENTLYLARRIDRYGWSAIQANARGAAIALPLLLSYFALVGLRRAFRLPADPAANWVFRCAEDPARRRDWLDTAWTMFVGLGVAGPLLVCAPGLWILLPAAQALPVLGWQAILALGLANFLMLGWNIVPFTSMHHPARRHLLHSIVSHLALLMPFWLGGAMLIEKSLGSVPVACTWTAVSLGGLVALHRARLRTWAVEPLAFVEPDPSEVTTLRLS